MQPTIEGLRPLLTELVDELEQVSNLRADLVG